MGHDELTILEYSGQILPETSDAVRQYAARWGISNFNSIIETHVMSEVQLRDALAHAMRLEVCEEIQIQPGWAVCPDLLSYALARENYWFLLRRTQDQGRSELHLFAANPLNLHAFKSIGSVAGFPTIVQIAEKSEVMHAIDLHYPLREQL